MYRNTLKCPFNVLNVTLYTSLFVGYVIAMCNAAAVSLKRFLLMDVMLSVGIEHRVV